ncbi:MAG TPA: rhodanese-like domain-containing protein [Alphaproteobacteria bacterium]|nr:rhodanese-like domain-containing protein [Alphaproteobacteria bacterium]
MAATEPFEIDPAILKDRLASDDPPVILDVREPWEIEIAALPDVLSIPLHELVGRVADVPRDRPVAVMCHHGGRSAQATAWLRQQGFARVMNVAGGIDAWARTVDPSVSRY